MVHLGLTTSTSQPASASTNALSKLYKAALRTPLPTRDDILSLLLHPSTTSSDLQSISALLQSAAFVSRLPSFRLLQLSDTTPRHCVRCHASYTDARNTRGACVVPHASHHNDYNQYTWIQGPDRLEDATVGSGVCYWGYHTEDVDEVEAEGGYNGINIRRCDEGVCTRGSQ